MIKCPRTQALCYNPECGKTTGICASPVMFQSLPCPNCQQKEKEIEKYSNESMVLEMELLKANKEIAELKGVRNSYNELNNRLAEDLRIANGEIERLKGLIETYTNEMMQDYERFDESADEQSQGR